MPYLQQILSGIVKQAAEDKKAKARNLTVGTQPSQSPAAKLTKGSKKHLVGKLMAGTTSAPREIEPKSVARGDHEQDVPETEAKAPEMVNVEQGMTHEAAMELQGAMLAFGNLMKTAGTFGVGPSAEAMEAIIPSMIRNAPVSNVRTIAPKAGMLKKLRFMGEQHPLATPIIGGTAIAGSLVAGDRMLGGSTAPEKKQNVMLASAPVGAGPVASKADGADLAQGVDPNAADKLAAELKAKQDAENKTPEQFKADRKKKEIQGSILGDQGKIGDLESSEAFNNDVGNLGIGLGAGALTGLGGAAAYNKFKAPGAEEVNPMYTAAGGAGLGLLTAFAINRMKKQKAV